MGITPRMPAAVLATALLVTGVVSAAESPLQKEVADTERAFAKTMAMRDHAGFVSHLSPEAVFFSRNRVLHGKEEVAAAWKRYYEGADAPFSWEPDQVEVLDSGDLALSTGPVRDPQGRQIGRFNSIWRRDASGKWRIVFDKGDTPCDCARP